MTSNNYAHMDAAVRDAVEGKVVSAFREDDGWPTLYMEDGTIVSLTTSGEDISYEVRDTLWDGYKWPVARVSPGGG